MAQERKELFDLYRIAIDEYRFEVKLNTDRMIHYIVFNTALFSAGTGLVKIAADPILEALVAVVFLVGIFTSWLGRRAIAKGHEYYQRTRYQKTLIEDLLGLAEGMTRSVKLRISAKLLMMRVGYLGVSTEKYRFNSARPELVTNFVLSFWHPSLIVDRGLIDGERRFQLQPGGDQEALN